MSDIRIASHIDNHCALYLERYGDFIIANSRRVKRGVGYKLFVSLRGKTYYFGRSVISIESDGNAKTRFRGRADDNNLFGTKPTLLLEMIPDTIGGEV